MTSCNNLPEELMVEILSRLPVKSLLQLRSVCKPWLALISSPNFIHTHLNHSATNPNNGSFIAHSYQANNFPNHKIALLNLNSLENPIILEHTFLNSISPSDMEVVGSCNGLLCLTNSLGHICLWNPATKRVKDISNFTIKVVDTTGEVSVGFGYDGMTNDYKVVRIVWTSRSENCLGRVEVYAVNKACWREIEAEVDFELIHGSCHVIVKGNPYWMGFSHRWEVKRHFFVSFDVHGEVFSKIPWPDQCIRSRQYGSIVEFEESLAVIVGKWDKGRISGISVWAIDDTCGGERSWTKKLAVGSLSEIGRLLGCLKNGEIVAEKSMERQLVVYDTVTEEIKPTQVCMRTLGVHSYVESLVN